MLPTRDQPVCDATPIADTASPEGFAAREPRHLTILLVARLVTQGGDALARVRNISTGGMMLECSMALTAGEAVRIELRSARTVEGQVAWASPPHAGIAFDTPVDIVQLLHRVLPDERSPLVARAPRLATCCTMQVCHAGRSRHAALLDLSQGGGRAQGLGGAVVGDQIGVGIPGLPARKAVVRWAREDDIGFVFLDPIPFAELDRWLQNPALRFAAADRGD